MTNFLVLAIICCKYQNNSSSVRMIITRTIIWVTRCQRSCSEEYRWINHVIYHKLIQYDDVIKWTHSTRYWPFVRGIHWSAVNSHQKGQWRGALMFLWSAPDRRFSKLSWGLWFETPSHPLWRRCDDESKNSKQNCVYITWDVIRMHLAYIWHVLLAATSLAIIQIPLLTNINRD